MNIVTGELPDRLAAEYVLGTLSGGARRRFDALLPAHPALRQAVAGWEKRLLPMALKAEAVQPAPRVWTSLESRLGWAPPPKASSLRVRFWQAFAAAATVAAVVLGTSTPHVRTEAPMIVVLHATKGSETIVAGLSPDRQQLSIQPLQKVALTSDQSLEPMGGSPTGAPTGPLLFVGDLTL